MKLTDRGAERCVNGAELDVHEDRNTQALRAAYDMKRNLVGIGEEPFCYR